MWPVLGGPEQWPVYRGSAAHIAAGQGPGCDLGNQLDLPWIAVGDGGLVSYGYESTDAGWFCDLHFSLGGYGWQLRYCHGREQPHPETDEEWTGGGVTARWPVKRGDVIGHVGYSGLTDPAGPAGAHLHNACWRDGVRVKPELLYALLQEEPTPEEDDMTDAQKAECRRIAAIMDSWALNHEERAAQAESVGYGITDSYSTRVAGDLRGLATALREVEGMAKGEAVEQ